MGNYLGIDYGSIGQVNRNKDTGIHYGVISQHSLHPEVIDDVIFDGADYGGPTCGHCGNEAVENNDENNARITHVDGCETPTDPNCDCLEFERTKHGCDDYLCLACRVALDSSEVFSEQMQGFTHESDGYKLTDCLDTDVFVIESPFYTYAQFCSPCVPGAGNLDSPITINSEYPLACGWGDLCTHTTEETCIHNQGGPKVYCLGHDWFEGNKAPYRIFKVSDDSEVLPEGNEVTK